MEIKVNREIRSYNEALFLGLSLRQLVFSALAILVAVGVYFLLRNTLSMETLSWLCVLCAAPFAALGFVTYNGMTAAAFGGNSQIPGLPQGLDLSGRQLL